MITHRVLCFLAVAAALAGCGSSATETAHRTLPAEEATADSAFGWQTELDRRAQGRIAEPLWLWLDGDLPDGVDVFGVDEQTVRVTAKLRHGLYEDEVEHFTRLGFEAVEGAEEIRGAITRDQLLDAAREHNVLRLDAAAAAAAEEPSEEAMAQAGTEERRRRM